MRKLKLTAIRLDGNTQPREKLDNERVDLYAENMKNGDKFPPITVHYDGSNYWLSSGFHRYAAHDQNGIDEIDAEIVNGTLEEAQIYAFTANSKHGLPLTPQEKRDNVIKMLSNSISKNWSDKNIAKHVGVSSMTVGRIRKEHRPEGDSAIKTYTTKDGKTRTINTENIGRKPTKKPSDAPPPPPEEDAEDHRVQELVETINEVNAENQRLKDAIALGQWDASDIEKMDAEETIAQLREQIRVLEIDNHALRDSRDMFQNRNAELMKTVKSLQARLKKLEG